MMASSIFPFSRMNAGRLALAATIVAGLALPACSGADNGDPTATVPAPTETATTAPSPTATATVTPEPTATATLEPTATATATATLTATPEPTATPTPEPTATAEPTVVALPDGGGELRILGKAIHEIVPGDDAGNVLYAITAVGISRSRDGGRTWTASGDTQEGRMVVALNDPDVLYAGDFAPCAAGGEGALMTRSTDGGFTWEEFAGGLGVRPLLVEAGQSSTVIGSDCSPQISTDGGQHFTGLDGAENFDVYAAASSDPESLTDHIVVLGVSEGGTGRLILYDLSGQRPSFEGELVEFFGLGAVAWSGGRIVVATPTGVGVSDDNGATWSWSRAGLEDATYSVNPLEEPVPDDEAGQPFGFTVVAIHPEDPDRIWIGGQVGAFVSEDGGQTWAQLGDDSAIDSLVVAAGVDRVYVSSDGGTRAWGIGE
jgi:hypothetical protein